ncbi:MAG: DUF1178 family protein [Proteobacteria bacterium]|nr:DUF1178 family protein [Pseudomonadota bacterium]
MIKYLLGCASGHEFESWFRAGADFDAQSRSGEIACPLCGSIDVVKQPMAPSVVTKRARAGRPPAQEPAPAPVAGGATAGADGVAVREALKAFTQKVIANTEDVGPRFAEEARRMHFGEIEERQIRGSSTVEEAQELAEDGVPFGIIPVLPEDLN